MQSEKLNDELGSLAPFLLTPFQDGKRIQIK